MVLSKRFMRSIATWTHFSGFESRYAHQHLSPPTSHAKARFRQQPCDILSVGCLRRIRISRITESVVIPLPPAFHNAIEMCRTPTRTGVQRCCASPTVCWAGKSCSHCRSLNPVSVAADPPTPHPHLIPFILKREMTSCRI